MPGPQAGKRIVGRVLEFILRRPVDAHCASTIAAALGISYQQARSAVRDLSTANKIVITAAPPNSKVQASAAWYRAPGATLDYYWKPPRRPLAAEEEHVGI